MEAGFQSIGRDRRIIFDILHLAGKVPSFPVDRLMDLTEVAEARSALAVNCRISWATLFIKAYGYVSDRHPLLRKCYMSWPYPHFYQQPETRISFAVHRSLSEGDRLFFGLLHEPGKQTLMSLQRQISEFQKEDVSRKFKKQLMLAHFPAPLRRLLWFWRMEVAAGKRARRVGTGSFSNLAGQGCSNRLHPCMLTTSLSYSPLNHNGETLVTLQCDHRVLDGVPAAAALLDMEAFLRTDLLAELRGLRHHEEALQSGLSGREPAAVRL